MAPLSFSASSARFAPSIPANTIATHSAPAAASTLRTRAASSANTSTTSTSIDSASSASVLSPLRSSRRRSLRSTAAKPATVLPAQQRADSPAAPDLLLRHLRRQQAAGDFEHCELDPVDLGDCDAPSQAARRRARPRRESAPRRFRRRHGRATRTAHRAGAARARRSSRARSTAAAPCRARTSHAGVGNAASRPGSIHCSAEACWSASEYSSA